MPFAVIATDLDGTLLQSDRTISLRTRTALRAAQSSGVVVALVTARPPWAVDLIPELVALDAVAICCNGAVVYDMGRREVISRRNFSAGAYSELITGLRDCAPGIAFVVQQGVGCSRDLQEGQFPPLWDDWSTEKNPRIECALAVPGESVVKIIAHHPDHSADALRAVVADWVGARADISHSDSVVIELTPSGVSKASGVSSLCQGLGIDLEQVVAFGDMPNDIPMLAIAGLSVGMSNAHPDVLAMVDEVTMSNDDDGVARVIERLLAQT